jgi:predicted Zn-dependent protease with MMP-like domain
MIDVTDTAFQALIAKALDELKPKILEKTQNIAITWAHEPSTEQRHKLALLPGHSLYGLYEGVPLTKRAGVHVALPDKVTIFKYPMVWRVANEIELEEQIKTTVWHEIAHHYGLDHEQIAKLD